MSLDITSNDFYEVVALAENAEKYWMDSGYLMFLTR